MRGHIVLMKLPVTSCPELLWPSESSEQFPQRNVKLNTKSDADLLFYLLGHFECDGHTVHMLTQWFLLPPLTSTVKSSLFPHSHSSPLSLAASWHDVAQTVLITLTMAGLFPDRPQCVCLLRSMSSSLVGPVSPASGCWTALQKAFRALEWAVSSEMQCKWMFLWNSVYSK